MRVREVAVGGGPFVSTAGRPGTSVRMGDGGRSEPVITVSVIVRASFRAVLVTTRASTENTKITATRTSAPAHA